MKVMFKKYLWLWEFIGVALIVGVGLVSKFVPDVLYFILGAAFIVLGLFRIIPLFKTTDDKVLRWIFLVEILIDIIVGILLIIIAINDTEIKNILGYLVGGVLYLRALIFFFSTTIRTETADWAQFIVHIVLITVGTWIIAKDGFSIDELGWVILIVSIFAAIFIAYSGYRNYNNYRHEYAAKRITKRVKKEESLEAPTSEEIIVPDNAGNIDSPINKDEQENNINA
jgi:uncharacterized membrane protein HdeD (DUF308 family)